MAQPFEHQSTAEQSIVQPSADSVQNLSGTPKPSETLAALRQEGQSNVANSQRLEAMGLLASVSIDSLSGTERQIADQYKQNFAWEAMPTAEKGIDPKTGATIMLFKDSSGHLQEVSIEDSNGSSHQYLTGNDGQIQFGQSFDAQGNGVSLDHLKWSVSVVDRQLSDGNRTTITYDDDSVLERK